MIFVVILFCIVMFVLTLQRSRRKKRELSEYANEPVRRGVTALKTTAIEYQSETPDIINIDGSKVRVKRTFLNRFIRGAIIDEELFWADEDSSGYVTTTVEELERMENRLAEFEARNRALTRCAELNNEGMRLEKQGDIDAAIAIYEQNISGDCYPATHSFDRLMILYRKRKDYQNERRVIQKAIRLFPKIEKYSKRLDVVNLKLNDSKV